jgi:hypothetical protein
LLIVTLYFMAFLDIITCINAVLLKSKYWTGWSRGNAIDLYPAQILARLLAVLTEVWFSSVPTGKYWDCTLFRLFPLPSGSFPIHQSAHHPTLYSLDTESIVLLVFLYNFVPVH